MVDLNGPTSWLRRHMLWLLAALILPAIVPLSAAPAAAEHPPGYGFQWGPSRPPETMREPLTDSGVLNALFMSVDADEISTRLLGEPSLLITVDDATYPRELRYGFNINIFAPEKAKMVLEDAGVANLAVTIAPDPAVAEAPKLAEAIAEDLRSYAGVQATVVDGDADFLVTRALGPSAPAAPGALSFEHACTPDTFRPDEWVVVDCVSRMTNKGDTTLVPYISVNAGTGTVPGYYFFSAERNGQPLPIQTGGLRFPAAELAAGETAVTRVLVLLMMSEGTYESSVDLNVNEDVVAKAPLHFTASPAAQDPPRDLEVTRELIAKKIEVADTPIANPPHDGFATYETTITNRGSQPISDLRVDARLGEVASMDSGPAPAEQDSTHGFASWELSSFGKESLQPGESLVLRTTYRPSGEDSCGTIDTAAVVEATVGGETQRYAVGESWETVGYCVSGGGGCGVCGGEVPTDANGMPLAFGSGGDGPDGDAFDIVWAAACLAAGGAALIGIALAVRRRVRR